MFLKNMLIKPIYCTKQNYKIFKSRNKKTKKLRLSIQKLNPGKIMLWQKEKEIIMKDEAILYLETADGETMAVPESKLNEFRRLNEKIKAEMQLKEKAKRDTGKPNFDEAIGATEEMFAEQAQEQAIQEKETKIKKFTDDIKTLRIMNRHMQETIEKLSKENEEYLIEKNKMKTTQRRKMRILIMAYIFVIIIHPYS